MNMIQWLQVLVLAIVFFDFIKRVPYPAIRRFFKGFRFNDMWIGILVCAVLMLSGIGIYAMINMLLRHGA